MNCQTYKEIKMSKNTAINYEHSDGGKKLLPILNKLNKIEQKERCLRVKFLDWLSDKLLDWSNRIHVMASQIDSPCLIQVTLRTKEDSKSATQSKEILRLQQLLKEEREKNK
jgi:hypothetical protein